LGIRVWNYACGSANHPRSARALGRLAIGPEASECQWRLINSFVRNGGTCDQVCELAVAWSQLVGAERR